LIFTSAQENGVPPRRFFSVLYMILLGTDRGPRAGTLIEALGADRVKTLIKETLP
jgi:lysyl-tRNA synthetase class 1